MSVSDGSDMSVRVIASRRPRLYKGLLMADCMRGLAKDRGGKEERNGLEVR